MQDAQIKTKLSEITSDVGKIVKQNSTIVIKTDDDMKKYTDLITGIKGRIKRAEELRLMFTRPLNEHIRNINAMFKDAVAPLLQVEKNIKSGMGEYHRQQEEAARKEEARLQKLADKRAERAAAKGKTLEYEVTPTVERPQSTVASSTGGKVTTKKVWRFEVTDETKVPRKYLVVDQTKIRAAVREGAREIDGVRIYEDVETSVFA